MKLLVDSSFDTISVGVIVRKAGVSRSSFYIHFQDKFELMDQLTTQVLHELEDHYKTTEWKEENIRVLRDDLNKKEPLPTTVALLEHILSYEYFYRDRYREPAFVVRLSELIGERLEFIFQDETFAIFLAYGTVGYIGRWISEGLKTPPYELALRLTSVARKMMESPFDKIK